MACRGCSSGDGCSCSIVGDGDGIVSVSGTGTPVTDPYEIAFDGGAWMETLTADDATACDALNDPHVPVLLGDGSVIMRELPCTGPLSISQQTADYTVVLGDEETMIEVGGAGDMVVTLPSYATEAIPIGSQVSFWVVGDTITFIAAGGVTVESEGGLLDAATQFTAVTAIKLDTDRWALIGKLT